MQYNQTAHSVHLPASLAPLKFEVSQVDVKVSACGYCCVTWWYCHCFVEITQHDSCTGGKLTATAVTVEQLVLGIFSYSVIQLVISYLLPGLYKSRWEFAMYSYLLYGNLYTYFCVLIDNFLRFSRWWSREQMEYGRASWWQSQDNQWANLDTSPHPLWFLLTDKVIQVVIICMHVVYTTSGTNCNSKGRVHNSDVLFYQLMILDMCWSSIIVCLMMFYCNST